jgi:hypothetical protein
MAAAPHPEPEKIGALIYLSSNRPLRLSDFFAEFHKTWPLGLLEKTGKEFHRATFRSGRSNFSIEMRHEPAPQAVTDRVSHHTLHWPLAEPVLSVHPAHLVVTCLDVRSPLTLACDLTKAIVALVPVTDSLAVCWMNGFALNPAKAFAATARDMFDTGLYPVNLWVAARFSKETNTLHTEGMAQFDAPEVILKKQPDPASLMIDYLFQVAQFVLTSPHKIKNGERMDSPHGLFGISLEAKGEHGRRELILDPL